MSLKVTPGEFGGSKASAYPKPFRMHSNQRSVQTEMKTANAFEISTEDIIILPKNDKNYTLAGFIQSLVKERLDTMQKPMIYN